MLTTQRAAIVGGAVGLLASGVVLVFLWFGVAGVLRTGHIDLMYLLWPSAAMLRTKWDRTLFGIGPTVPVKIRLTHYLRARELDPYFLGQPLPDLGR